MPTTGRRRTIVTCIAIAVDRHRCRKRTVKQATFGRARSEIDTQGKGPNMADRPKIHILPEDDIGWYNTGHDNPGVIGTA